MFKKREKPPLLITLQNYKRLNTNWRQRFKHALIYCVFFFALTLGILQARLSQARQEQILGETKRFVIQTTNLIYGFIKNLKSPLPSVRTPTRQTWGVEMKNQLKTDQTESDIEYVRRFVANNLRYVKRDDGNYIQLIITPNTSNETIKTGNNTKNNEQKENIQKQKITRLRIIRPGRKKAEYNPYSNIIKPGRHFEVITNTQQLKNNQIDSDKINPGRK